MNKIKNEIRFMQDHADDMVEYGLPKLSLELVIDELIEQLADVAELENLEIENLHLSKGV